MFLAYYVVVLVL